MDDYPVLDLTDVRGFERLYVTLVRDDMIKPGKYTLLYNWYQANAISCGKQDYFSRKAFCDRLANTDKKPYRTMLQACKAMNLVMWNIDVEVGQADWCAHSYEQMNGIWNEYQCMFRETYGLPPNSRYTSYKLCEESLYPKHEPLSDLDPQSVREKNAPRMVYICAPLRGEDMPANIERARMYARDVLLQGDVPFCPHIYFPQIADANDAMEDNLAMRTYDMAVEKHMIERIESICKNAAEEIGGTAKVSAPVCYPCLYNDPALAERLMESAKKVAGKENVVPMRTKMSSEDFAFYLTKKPGVFFRLGTRNEEKGYVGLPHNNNFQLDEAALKFGSGVCVQFVLDNMDGIPAQEG